MQNKGKRYRAENIRFARDSRRTNQPQAANKNRSFGSVLILLLSIGLAISVLTGKTPFAIPIAYVVMSVITFIAYAIDKSAAEKGRWRTQESTLHLMALIGGWPGAILGQMMLRHKSKKKAFRQVFWFTVLLNLIALAWLHTSSESAFLNSLGV